MQIDFLIKDDLNSKKIFFNEFIEQQYLWNLENKEEAEKQLKNHMLNFKNKNNSINKNSLVGIMIDRLDSIFKLIT